MHRSDFFRSRYRYLGLPFVSVNTINYIPVSEKYLHDGREYLGSKHCSRQRKPSSSTADIGWASKTMNSKTFCVIADAFKFARVSCLAVLSPAPLVLLSCRNSACSLARCFWMCLIKLAVSYFAAPPPPLETLTLQTLQTAVELFGVASVKYLHMADPLARSMVLNSELNSSSVRHTCSWWMT